MKWVVLGACDIVVSVVGLPNKDSAAAGAGRARTTLGSSRVRMKNYEKSHRRTGEGVLWRARGLATRSWVLPGALVL